MIMNSSFRRNPRSAGSGRTAPLCAALTLTGTVAMASMPAAAQTVELRWKLEAGTGLLYRTSIESESELPQGMGTTTMNMETTQRWNVTETDGDGNATISNTTDRVRMSVAGPMGTMSVDSVDEAGSGSPLEAIKALAGTSYSIVLDPRGGLVGISGLEELRAALRAQAPDPSAQAMLDSFLSEEALRSQWAQGAHVLPAEAVGVGSTWDHASTIPVPAFGAMEVVTSYRVESIDGDHVVIGMSGNMSPADGAIAASPIPVTLGEMTIAATTRFDAARGLLLGTDSTMTVQVTMEMGGQETVLDTVTTMTLELLEGQ